MPPSSDVDDSHVPTGEPTNKDDEEFVGLSCGSKLSGNQSKLGVRLASVSPRPQVSAVSPRSKREIELLEARVAAQLARVRDGTASSLEKMDRQRAVSIQRLDEKALNQEMLVAKIDRKVSEVVGAVRGLSEETQQLLRRADAVDARAWAFRHQVEEDMRQRHQEQETRHQDVLSKCRTVGTASEDAQRRLTQGLRRLETSVQERSAQAEQLRQLVMGLQDRLEVVEECSANQGAPADMPRDREVDRDRDERMWRVESLISDLAQKVEHMGLEAQGDMGWSARLEEHEVRLANMRSKLDSQDKRAAELEELSRQDWEARFEELRRGHQEALGRSIGGLEQLEALARRADSLDQSMEELRDACGLSSGAATAGRGPPSSIAQVQNNESIVVQREAWEEELSGKVKTLLQELRLMVPKLLDHDRHINELQATTAQLSARAVVLPPPVPTRAGELPAVLQAVEAGEEHSFGPLTIQENAEVHEDLDCLLQRVDDNEGECTHLHQQLHSSISTMDELLEKVTTQLLNHASPDGGSTPLLAMLRSNSNNMGANMASADELAA